jgi:hypothetical protein
VALQDIDPHNERSDMRREPDYGAISEDSDPETIAAQVEAADSAHALLVTQEDEQMAPERRLNRIAYRMTIGDIADESAIARIKAVLSENERSDAIGWFQVEACNVAINDHPLNPGQSWEVVRSYDEPS